MVLRGHTPAEPIGRAAVSAVIGPYSGGESAPQAKPWPLSRLLRYKWTIVLVSLLVAGAAIPAIWLLMAPKYTAKAEVRVRPIIPHLVFKTEENGMIPLYQSYMNTQVAIIRNSTVLGRVLDQKDVQETSWYKEPESAFLGAAKTPLERLGDVLTTLPRGQTEIIDVSVTALKGTEAALITNAVLDQYMVYLREKNDETSDVVYRKLTDEFDSLRTEIEGREKVVARLRKDLGTGAPDDLVSKMRIRLDEAEAKLTALRQDIAMAQWQEKELQDALAEAEITSFEKEMEALIEDAPESQAATSSTDGPKPRYESDDIWRQLNLSAKAAQMDLAIQRELIKETHPRMLELRKRAEVTETLLRDRQAQLDDEWNQYGAQLPPGATAPAGLQGLGVPSVVPPEVELARQLDDLRPRIRLMAHQEQLQVTDAENERAEFGRIFESAQLLTKENETIKHKRELYDAVRTRLDQKEMERNVPGSIEVLTRAAAPSMPSNDRRLLLTLLALAGALGAGVATAFMRASRSQDVHEVDDIAHAVPTPFLGFLPILTDTKESSFEKNPVLAESVRMLRTALLRRITSDGGTVVQVTSAESWRRQVHRGDDAGEEPCTGRKECACRGHRPDPPEFWQSLRGGPGTGATGNSDRAGVGCRSHRRDEGAPPQRFACG